MKLHKDYKRYIKYSKEGALQLIADLAVGYDGYNTIPGLKRLIDELRAIALLGLKQKEALDSPDEQERNEAELILLGRWYYFKGD